MFEAKSRVSVNQGSCSARGRLVLVRHGQSTFNAENRFTGWSDPPLTTLGEEEAAAVAEGLAAAGITVDAAFSSALDRTIASTRIILQRLGSRAQPRADPELNERDYGGLTGLNKAEAAARFGADQVTVWRRSYKVAPPDGESLRDVVARAVPFYLREILPVALRGNTVLVVAHGNTLRALVSALEGLSAPQVEALEIATGEIVKYDLRPDATLRRTQVSDLVSSRGEPMTHDAKTDHEWVAEAIDEELRVEHGLAEREAEPPTTAAKPKIPSSKAHSTPDGQ